MKRINIIDVPHYETDPKEIVDHLTEFLKKIRKDKVATDLIGGYDRSAEFDVPDFDMFGDGLSEGVELTFEDIRRSTARSNKLAKDRVAAAGVSHLKREEYERLEPSLDGMQVIMAKDQNWADEVAAKLHADMPWMARATEYAWHALRRSAQRGEPVLIRPVILNGPPGIGKSVWARSLATALETRYADVDPTKGGGGMALVGVERGWSTAQAGRPLEVLLAKKLANPLIVVDEICKAKSVTSSKGTSYSFGDALLSLLEPSTAKAWDCPYFRVRFDMSHISWVLTSSNVENVSEPVRNRCQVIEIAQIATEHEADEIAAALHAEMPWMKPATEAVWHGLRASARNGPPGLRINPLVLVGSPGIGKSYWARRLAHHLAVPTTMIDATGEPATFAIVGSQRGWSSATPGQVDANCPAGTPRWTTCHCR